MSSGADRDRPEGHSNGGEPAPKPTAADGTSTSGSLAGMAPPVLAGLERDILLAVGRLTRSDRDVTETEIKEAVDERAWCETPIPAFARAFCRVYDRGALRIPGTQEDSARPEIELTDSGHELLRTTIERDAEELGLETHCPWEDGGV